ncbi:protein DETOXIFICATION 35-like isoform X1 [Tasmannia lanceolata]|uniref:protein DETOXIFICATION 35-like isoform X1 n=1 Tax=Tasmannia lanceolata TaxID=3420 RepID=UPI0040630267
MEAALLMDSGGMVEASGDYRAVTGYWEAMGVFRKESRKLWDIATPIMFNMLCVYGINSTTQIFVGHIGNLDLSAVAIALSVISLFSFGFLLGMGSALETLCGQAFGAGQVHMLGIYMQRSWIILFVSCIIISPIYIFATPILELIGQETAIANLAGKFSLYILPQLFSLPFVFTTQKFLQAQSKVWVLSCIGFASLLIQAFLLWIFIYVFGWGLVGAAAAFDISGWVLALAQVIYVMGWCKDGWKGFSWLAFQEIWAFVRLSLASAVMLCLEIWYMMTLVVLTGHLGNAEISVGSISICMNINGWEVMVFIGLNAAISVRVSNELGSGHPRATKYAIIVVVLQSLFIGLFFMALILIFRTKFAVIFTSSKDLQEAVSHLAFLLGITMVLNSIQPVISGVAIGGGWQSVVAYINLGCYYIFGLPFGFLMGYTLNLGVEGIWAGMICGTALQTLILLVIIWRTNWSKEADQASERVQLWGGDEHEAPKLQI